MAELRAFYVNPSKIPDEPLEVVFAYHCATRAHKHIHNPIFKSHLDKRFGNLCLLCMSHFDCLRPYVLL